MDNPKYIVYKDGNVENMIVFPFHISHDAM